MAPTFTPDRQQFRSLVAQVAEQARALLPVSVNGRIESAVTLVLAGDVFFLDNGTVEVGSASDPQQMHVLTGAACDCADFPRAPASWCKHRIAANIQRSVERVLARTMTPEPAPVDPEMMPEPWPDNDLEEGPAPQPPTPAPASLPEAPASVNVRVTIGGREVQWTLRDTDEVRVAMRLEHLLARYPLPQPAAPQTSRPEPEPQEQRWCPKHGEKMQINHKEGRSWWSHRTADGWCKGR